MKIKGKATILFDRDDGLRIELECDTSGITFAVANLDKDQTIAALSRQAMVDCELDLRGLERVGKTVEIDRIEFPMPYHHYIEKKDVAAREAVIRCSDGWTPDLYFGSQDSFFKKDGHEWARTFIRRYV